MDKEEQASPKTNSSVPDIVFYQLKMDKEERVIGFIEKDSDEHFGKLARKGGEILLPGVFPQKTRLPEDLKTTKAPDVPTRRVQMKVDLPTSDTELETLLFYDGSSAELRCLGKDDPRKSVPARKKSDESQEENACERPEVSIHADTSEVILQTEQLIEVKDVAPEDSGTKIPDEKDS